MPTRRIGDMETPIPASTSTIDGQKSGGLPLTRVTRIGPTMLKPRCVVIPRSMPAVSPLRCSRLSIGWYPPTGGPGPGSGGPELMIERSLADHAEASTERHGRRAGAAGDCAAGGAHREGAVAKRRGIARAIACNRPARHLDAQQAHRFVHRRDVRGTRDGVRRTVDRANALERTGWPL